MNYLQYRQTNHGITFLYQPHQCTVDPAQYEIFCVNICDIGGGGGGGGGGKASTNVSSKTSKKI